MSRRTFLALENVLADQFLKADRRLGIEQGFAGLEVDIGAARRDLHEFVADDAGRAHGRDGIFLKSNAFVDSHGDLGRVVLGVELDGGDLFVLNIGTPRNCWAFLLQPCLASHSFYGNIEERISLCFGAEMAQDRR